MFFSNLLAHRPELLQGDLQALPKGSGAVAGGQDKVGGPDDAVQAGFLGKVGRIKIFVQGLGPLPPVKVGVDVPEP